MRCQPNSKSNYRLTARTSFSICIWAGVLAIQFYCDTSPLYAQGKLGRVRNEVREHDPPVAASSKKDRDEDDDKKQNRGKRKRRRRPSTGLNFLVVDTHHHVHHQVSPVVAPIIEAPQPYPQPQTQPQRQTQPQPIYESVVEPANSIVEEAIDPIVNLDSSPEPDWFHTETSRLWATLGSDFDDIDIANLGFALQIPGGIGLGASVFNLRESLPTSRDHIWIGDVNLLVETLVATDLRGRIGVGVNWLGDSFGGEAGFNLTADLDARLSQRLTLSFEGDLGNLGDADFLHAKVSLARRFDGYEILVGGEHFDIGGTDINSFFVGLQTRF